MAGPGAPPPFDVVGVGLNATDTLLIVPHFPAYAGKVPFHSEHLSPGGQVASAMVACACLGLRAKYIGSIGDDERGRIQMESLRGTGVNLDDVQIRRHASANQFVKEMNAQGKLVAAICHGGWVLCSAGILKGRRATCFFAIKDDVVNAGARYQDEEVVVDANLVTSRKPEDLPAFCRASIKVMAGEPVAV